MFSPLISIKGQLRRFNTFQAFCTFSWQTHKAQFKRGKVENQNSTCHSQRYTSYGPKTPGFYISHNAP